MKAQLALLFALSLYLLPNPTQSTRNPIRLPTTDVAATSNNRPVVDSDGDVVLASGTYYIQSAISVYGGVKLAHLDKKTICPSDVIIGGELENVDPNKITPADPKATVVLQSTYQNFKFDFLMLKLCVNNVSWEVQYDTISKKGFVKASDIVSYNFKIERVPSPSLYFYKITYCPFDVCYNVGLYYDELVRAIRLVLSDNPFTFVFTKSS